MMMFFAGLVRIRICVVHYDYEDPSYSPNHSFEHMVISGMLLKSWSRSGDDGNRPNLPWRNPNSEPAFGLSPS